MRCAFGWPVTAHSVVGPWPLHARHRPWPSNVVTAQALQAEVQRRYGAGELARIDANLAQREVLSAQGALADSAMALVQAEQAFRALTGSAAPARLPPESPLRSKMLAPDHPLLAAASAALERAQAQVRQTDATRRTAPELAFAHGP